MTDYQIFEAGDVVLQSGLTYRGAKLAYKTFGTLNAAKDNAIVYPTWYSGRHWENEWLVGGGMTIADISLYAYTHVAPEGGFDLESYPAVRAWLDRVTSQPGYVPIDA